MKVKLSVLNESYAALVKLTQAEFPKEHHKLAYKLSRVLKSAKNELETAQESLNDLMRACGFEPGEQNVDPAKLTEFQKQMNSFMRGVIVNLWGDPIKLEDIADVVAISPFDLALLDWLIVEEEELQATPCNAPVALLSKSETA
jgi:hypothetical protein